MLGGKNADDAVRFEIAYKQNRRNCLKTKKVKC